MSSRDSGGAVGDFGRCRNNRWNILVGEQMNHEHNPIIKFKEERFMAEQKPSIGRIVHYVVAGNHVHIPGVITTVNPETVNIHLFFDPLTVKSYSMEKWGADVPYDSTGQAVGTWHWPERA